MYSSENTFKRAWVVERGAMIPSDFFFYFYSAKNR